MLIEESIVASPPTPPPAPAADAVHWLQSLEGDMRHLLDAIPTFTDDQLQAVLVAANALGVVSWRVRAAVCHQILARAQNRQGRPDPEQKSIWNTAAQAGSLLGVGAKQIRQDAEIHENFFSRPTSFAGEGSYDQILTERGYYEAALEAASKHGADPHEMLEKFAKAKLADDRFSVSDARRHARAGTIPDLEGLLPPLLGNPGFESAFKDFKRAAHALSQASHRRLAGLIRQYITEIEEEARDNAVNWLEKLEALVWREKYDEVDTLAVRLGVDREWVKAWFDQLKVKGWMDWTEKETTETARGAPRKSWQFTQAYWDAKLKRRPEDQAWI